VEVRKRKKKETGKKKKICKMGGGGQKWGGPLTAHEFNECQSTVDEKSSVRKMRETKIKQKKEQGGEKRISRTGTKRFRVYRR